MKYHHPLTTRFGRWLYQYANRLDYGIVQQTSDGSMRPGRALPDDHHYGAWELSKRKLKLRMLDHHLMNQHPADTLYYTSDPKRERGLLMLDIDAHEGQTDAADLAAWIEARFLPGAYSEPSTHLLGRHMYFLVPAGNVRRFELNDRFKLVASALRGLADDEGYESTVCGIYGTYSIRDGHGGFKCRGSLGKIPRPKTEDDLNALKNVRCHDWSYLGSIVNHAEALGLLVEADRKKVGEKKQAGNSGYIYSTLGYTPPSTSKYGPTSTNSFHRKVWAVDDFFRRRKRYPSIIEALDFYEINCNCDGIRDRKRIRDMTGAIRLHQNWYDPTKIHKPEFSSNHPFEPEQFLPLVQSLQIPPDELRFAVTKDETRPMSELDLAVFIGIVMEIAFNMTDEPDRDCAARSRIIGYWRKLRDSGQVHSSCYPTKYKGLRDLCQKYNLIDIYEPHIPPVRGGGRKLQNGKGMLLGPGTVNPLYFEFMNRRRPDDYAVEVDRACG